MHSCVWVRDCCMEAIHTMQMEHPCFPICSPIPLNLSIFLFLFLPFFPLLFLFLLETQDTPSIFIGLPCPTNAIWAKKLKQTKGQKKGEIIDLMSTSIRGKGGKEQHREIEERKKRDWKWAVGNTQVMLMEKWKNTNVDREISEKSKNICMLIF